MYNTPYIQHTLTSHNIIRICAQFPIPDRSLEDILLGRGFTHIYTMSRAAERTRALAHSHTENTYIYICAIGAQSASRRNGKRRNDMFACARVRDTQLRERCLLTCSRSRAAKISPRHVYTHMQGTFAP